MSVAMDGLSSLLGAYSAPEPKRERPVVEPAAGEPAAKKGRSEAPLLPPVDSDEEAEEAQEGPASRKTARTETRTEQRQAARLPARPLHLVPPQVRRGVPNRSTEDVADLFSKKSASKKTT